MRQAIFTKVIAPTLHRGTRIKAYSESGSCVISYNAGLNEQENHEMAAIMLAMKFDWAGKWHGGKSPEEEKSTYVFVAEVEKHND